MSFHSSFIQDNHDNVNEKIFKKNEKYFLKLQVNLKLQSVLMKVLEIKAHKMYIKIYYIKKNFFTELK